MSSFETVRPRFFGRHELCAVVCGRGVMELLEAREAGEPITVGASPDTLFGAYELFRDYEQWLHPADRFPNCATYYNPTFARIEKAHGVQDDEALARGVRSLVGLVLEN